MRRPRSTRLQGRTGPRCRRLVHALAGFLPVARFLEISADSGAAAALSALHAGDVEATVIDGGWRDPAGLVARNREAASVAARDLIVLLGDFRMGRGVDLGVFDVLVYGGAPDPAEFQDAMDVYLPSLADAHVLVVENWNHHPMRSGFSDFLERSGARVAYAAEIRTTMDNSIPSEPDPGGWGNGCYVAVVEKRGDGLQGLHSDVERPENLARLDLAEARLGRDAAAVARPVASPPVEDVEDADLHRRVAVVCREFESLGTDCEFGLVQRQLGIEQISLLRWAGLSHASLMHGLADGFAALLDSDAIRPELHGRPGTREYLIFHQTAKIMYHTFRYEGACDPDELVASQKKYLAYLRLKFLDDLRLGQKLYIWKSNEPASLEDVSSLLQSLRSHGPNRLLWVCEAGSPRQAGRVEALSDHLFRGYVDRFSVGDTSFGSWFRVCAAAGLLWDRMR